MEFRTFKWDEVVSTGNRLGFLPNPEMLTDEGHEMIRTIKLRGAVSRETIKVIYDRDYVLTWLEYHFFRQLSTNSFNDLQRVFGDAYKLHKELKEFKRIMPNGRD